MTFSKLKITLHMRSGAQLHFLTDNVTKTYKGNELTGLEGKNNVGWPFYFRLDAIEAVTTRRVWGFWL